MTEVAAGTTPATPAVPAVSTEVPAVPARRRGGGRIVRLVLLAIFLIVLAVFILGPLLWLAVHAFSDPNDWPYPHLLPSRLTFKWWHTVLSDHSLLDSIKQSFTFAPIVTVVSAAVCLPAAYAFSRLQFPGRQAMLVSLFAANAFPKIGLFVALAGLLYTFHLMQTFLGVVIVQLLGTLVYMTWIPAAAFASVPRSLEEAARDVGAGPLRVFFRVTLPLAAPGIVVAVILSFIAAFDEAQGTYLVGAPTYVTMPTQMYTLVLNYPEPAAAVFSILLSIPSLVLMLLVRRHVMGGRLAEGFQLR